MKKWFTFTGIGAIGGFLLLAQIFVSPGPVYGDFNDIVGNVNVFGANYPGVLCKTRTNNEASVRNLAHGVKNRDTNDLVALNCGMPAPYPVCTRAFGDNRIAVNITVFFGRNASVSNDVFEQARCAIYVSSAWDGGESPASADSTSILLGQARANSYGGSTKVSRDFVSTLGVTLPSSSIDGNFFSAFCQIPRGVRIQMLSIDPISTGTW